MRVEVKIWASNDNHQKLYYTCMNKPKCDYYKWSVSERDNFNNGVVFELNMVGMVDSHVISIIDNNVK